MFLIVFAVLTVVLVFVVLPKLRERRAEERHLALADRGDQLLGRREVVLRDLPDLWLLSIYERVASRRVEPRFRTRRGDREVTVVDFVGPMHDGVVQRFAIAWIAVDGAAERTALVRRWRDPSALLQRQGRVRSGDEAFDDAFKQFGAVVGDPARREQLLAAAPKEVSLELGPGFVVAWCQVVDEATPVATYDVLVDAAVAVSRGSGS